MKTVALLIFSIAYTAVQGYAQTTGSTGGGQPAPNRQPTLAVQYYLMNSGSFPSGSAGFGHVDHEASPWFGEIRAFSFNNVVPTGLIPCDGRLLTIGVNTAMFSLLGNAYGGNGSTTFAVPDLRGTVPIGIGQGPGLPNYTWGQRVGAENYAFTTGNLPAHTHAAFGSTTGSTGNGTPLNNLQPSLAVNYCIATNGEIILFAGSFAPIGWRLCDGSLIQISQWPTLYACIGTNYGGNGTTTFALPDLRGRAPVSAGAGAGSTYALGQTNGTDTTVLTPAQMPAHTHSLSPGNTGTTGGGAAIDTRQPTLALTWLLAPVGFFPSILSDYSSPMIGELRLVAGNAATWGSGWVPADGAQRQIVVGDTFDDLFSLIGTTYGGDGETVFNVPDLRGRLAVSVGQFPGYSNYALGDAPGSETFTLNVNQMPAHTHTLAPVFGAQSPAGSNLTNNATVVDFGLALYRTAGQTRTFYLTNTGTAHLTLGPATMEDGTNSFVVGTIPTDLAPGAGTNFTVRFAPFDNVGPQTWYLTLPNNDGARNPFIFRLSGYGLLTLPVVAGPKMLGNGTFQFAFDSVHGATYTVLGTTNLAQPLTNWTVLGPPVETVSGHFQFTDSQSPTNLRRYYRLRSP